MQRLNSSKNRSVGPSSVHYKEVSTKRGFTVNASILDKSIKPKELNSDDVSNIGCHIVPLFITIFPIKSAYDSVFNVV